MQRSGIREAWNAKHPGFHFVTSRLPRCDILRVKPKINALRLAKRRQGEALREQLARSTEWAAMAKARAGEIEKRANDLNAELARVNAQNADLVIGIGRGRENAASRHKAGATVRQTPIAANEQLRLHALIFPADEIDDATVHCQKAMNYAFEYGIDDCVGYTQEFAKDFGGFMISDVLKDYPDILGRAAAASSFVELKDLRRPINEYRDTYDTVYQDWNKVYKLREDFRNKSTEIKSRNRLATGTIIVAFLAAAGTAING